MSPLQAPPAQKVHRRLAIHTFTRHPTRGPAQPSCAALSHPFVPHRLTIGQSTPTAASHRWTTLQVPTTGRRVGTFPPCPTCFWQKIALARGTGATRQLHAACRHLRLLLTRWVLATVLYFSYSPCATKTATSHCQRRKQSSHCRTLVHSHTILRTTSSPFKATLSLPSLQILTTPQGYTVLENPDHLPPSALSLSCCASSAPL